MKIANEEELIQFLQKHAPNVPEAPLNEWETLVLKTAEQEDSSQGLWAFLSGLLSTSKMATGMAFAMVLFLSFYGVRMIERRGDNHLVKVSGPELQQILDFSGHGEASPIGQDWL